jgi:hypothetical protein
MAIGSVLRLSVVAMLTLAGPAAAAGSDSSLGLPMTMLSSYRGYAEQVAAECLRNRAYGLTTNGMPLKAFCQRQGDIAAMAVAQRIAPERARAAGVAAAPR